MKTETLNLIEEKLKERNDERSILPNSLCVLEKTVLKELFDSFLNPQKDARVFGMSRHIWTENDIKGGIYVAYQSYPDNKDVQGLCSVAYQIGYTHRSPRKGGNQYHLSSIADGMTLNYENINTLLDSMNDEAHLGYRLLSHNDIVLCAVSLISNH